MEGCTGQGKFFFHLRPTEFNTTLIQLKVVHRVHLSKARLAEIYLDFESNCDHAGSSQADLS